MFCDEIGEFLEYSAEELLLQASEEYESTQRKRPAPLPELPPPTMQQDSSHTPNAAAPPPTTVRFAPPQSEAEILSARERAIPKRTQQDRKYCLHIWDDWRAHRKEITGADIPPLQELPLHELQHWLTMFILEARKKTGEVYPPNTLHHIVCGLMRHMRQSGNPQVDFFRDPEFSAFRASLDAEMKRLQGEGVGSTKKQAEVLTEAEENMLWEKGLLGDDSAQALLDTIVFCTGLYFALRSGQEHRQLRRDPSQIEVVEHAGERAYLKYTEDTSKNHPGGLKGRKITQKVVLHHTNLDNPQRCFVRLFKLYLDKCPQEAPPHALYLRPSTNPTTSCWYSKCPLGHTTLSKTVSRLCQSAGIPGFKTNHSLRATATSRLYHCGVDEQLIMERTGHRSLEGVRSYKRTSNTQRENLSSILNQEKPHNHSTTPHESSSCTQIATSSLSMSLGRVFHLLCSITAP